MTFEDAFQPQTFCHSMMWIQDIFTVRKLSGLLWFHSRSLCKHLLRCQYSRWILLTATALFWSKDVVNSMSLEMEPDFDLSSFYTTFSVLSKVLTSLNNEIFPDCIISSSSIQETSIISIKHKHFEEGFSTYNIKVQHLNMQHFTCNFSVL